MKSKSLSIDPDSCGARSKAVIYRLKPYSPKRSMYPAEVYAYMMMMFTLIVGVGLMLWAAYHPISI